MAARPPRTHAYAARVVWTGNRGQGNRPYRGYDRTWDVATSGKPVIHCSNDPLLGGNPGLPNPEDLLLASVASCHMLWYLHLALEAGIVVHAYTDEPEGTGEVGPKGEGRFLAVTLRPRITVEPGTDIALATRLHHDVHKYCFIARSVSFPIGCEPVFVPA